MMEKTALTPDGMDTVLSPGNKGEKNWKGIVLALLVILSVCSLITVAIVLLTPSNEELQYGEPYPFNSIFTGDFTPSSVNLQWVKGLPNHYVTKVSSNLVLKSANDSSERILVSSQIMKGVGKYFLSETASYILLVSNIKQVYRHSFTANYSVLDTDTPSATPTHIPSPDPTGKPIQYAGFIPNHKIVVVAGNNLYIGNISATFKQITFDGEHEKIFNGIPDWVYEEEVLSAHYANWASPSGTWLCHARFDDTHVRLYKYPFYGSPKNAYDSILHVAYPKPGFANPTVSINVTSTTSGESFSLQSPDTFGEHYFTSVSWANDSNVAVTWINRKQNCAQIILYKFSAASLESTLNGTVILNVCTSRMAGGWIDLYSGPTFSKDGTQALSILPLPVDADFYPHIFDILSPKFQAGGIPNAFNKLTGGKEEVIRIAGYDKSRNILYYISTGGDSRKRHLYSIPVNSTKSKGKCLTCSLSQCDWVSATLSPNGKYYYRHCGGPGVPTSALVAIETGKEQMLEDNSNLSKKVKKLAMPVVEYKEITVGSGRDTFKTWAKLLLPRQLKKNEVTKYPLVVQVYNGPNSQLAQETFSTGWATYLVTNHRIIYAYIDGRGSAANGLRFRHAVYRTLGQYETDDQIAGARQLLNLPYIDPSRTAIWGWSYGGYMSAHVMGRGKGPYQCGIAVAPVTDFRYYDTIYTERYMGLPTIGDNLKGYDKTNVSALAHNFEDNRFFLIHGSADDNVHFQHSAHLVKALTEEEKQFKLMVYPDKTHGILGFHIRRHLYRSLTNFLENCFGQFQGINY